ncbi:MAG: glycosyltransferase family 9 protein [Ignavibacteriales bacterium]|nr:glycosyltransferase family 9 protein [Ignavibacteriales bacterium]
MSANIKRKLDDRFWKFLIVRTDRIGDVILTLPLAQVIKKHFPDAHITMLIREYTSELVMDNPNIDNIIYYDRDGEQVPFFKLLHQLRQAHFDVVLHTHPRARLAFLTWLALIPIRIGTGYRIYSMFFNRKYYEHRRQGSYHELEYNLHLLQAIGLSYEDKDYQPVMQISDTSKKHVEILLNEYGIVDKDKLIILHPGSKGSSRDWNPQNFGILGKYLAGLPDVKVAITGNKEELDLVLSVAEIAGPECIQICNKLSLGELGALAARASVFVSNSTGPIHIAAAVGTFVVGFYPQIPHLSATRWGPYTSKRLIFTPKDKPLDCTKCSGKNNNSCECMDSIEVVDVFNSIKTIIRENK